MADESSSATAAPTLSARDLEILLHAFRNPKSGGEFEVDYDKLAVCIGSKTVASARSSWCGVKKKLYANAPLASTAEGGPVVKAKTPRKKKDAAPKMMPKSDAKEGTDVGLEVKKAKSDDTAAEGDDTSNTNGDATIVDETSKDHTTAQTDGKGEADDHEDVGATVNTSSKDVAPLTPDASPVTSTSPGPEDEADKPVDGDATTAVVSDKNDAPTPAKTPNRKRAAPKKATPKEATTTNGDTKEGDKKPAAAPKKRGRPTNAEKAAALAATSETVDGDADVNDSEAREPAPKKRKTAVKKKPADTSNASEADAETVDGEESTTVEVTDTKATSKSPAPTAAAEKKKATPKPRTPKTPREPSKAAKAKQAKLDAATKEAEEEAQRATKEAEAKAELAVKKAAEAKAAKEANEVLMGKKAVATEVKEEENDEVNGDGDEEDDNEEDQMEIDAQLNEAIASATSDTEADDAENRLSKKEGNETKSGFTAINALADVKEEDGDAVVVDAGQEDA